MLRAPRIQLTSPQQYCVVAETKHKMVGLDGWTRITTLKVVHMQTALQFFPQNKLLVPKKCALPLNMFMSLMCEPAPVCACDRVCVCVCV